MEAASESLLIRIRRSGSLGAPSEDVVRTLLADGSASKPFDLAGLRLVARVDGSQVVLACHDGSARGLSLRQRDGWQRLPDGLSWPVRSGDEIRCGDAEFSVEVERRAPGPAEPRGGAARPAAAPAQPARPLPGEAPPRPAGSADGPPGPYFEIVDGPASEVGRRVPFAPRGGECRIGRSQPVPDLCLPDETARLSRSHLELAWRGGRPVVRDLSTNGTRLRRGSAVSPLDPGADVCLHDGDELELPARPPYRLRFTEPAADRPAPATARAAPSSAAPYDGRADGSGADRLIMLLAAELGLDAHDPRAAAMRADPDASIRAVAATLKAALDLGGVVYALGDDLHDAVGTQASSFGDPGLRRRGGATPPALLDGRGGLPAAAALERAATDVRRYFETVFDATSPLLDKVLDRLDPSEIENGSDEGFMGINRSAKLWERYKMIWKELKNDDDEFKRMLRESIREVRR
jgi:predicted component of type VI protein secretion system